MELRGYDTYEVTLGDEIRGERASRGKSVADVERELHIRRDILLAIENCDLSGVVNPSLLPGYVRSYARYLGMDADAFYARFCAEAGFVPPRMRFGADEGSGAGSIGKRLTGSPFDQSRFAVPPAQTRFSARVSLGALVSAAGLVILLGGLGYGGYAVLQNIQRVGIAPLPDAPEVIAVAPEIALPDGTAPGAPPTAEAYSGSGALAGVYAPAAEAAVVDRDGPISAIDPRRYGVYAGARPPAAPRAEDGDDGPRIDSADDAILAARARAAERAAEEAAMRERLAALTGEEAGSGSTAEPDAPQTQMRGIAVQVTGRAWIRVRNGDRAVIREGILEPGERYELPERVLRGTIRAGNAGAVYVMIDGEAYGPLGVPGGVVKNISLAPEDVRREQARAERDEVMMAGAGEPAEDRAAAD